jgi:hypothetical protein
LSTVAIDPPGNFALVNTSDYHRFAALPKQCCMDVFARTLNHDYMEDVYRYNMSSCMKLIASKRNDTGQILSGCTCAKFHEECRRRM